MIVKSVNILVLISAAILIFISVFYVGFYSAFIITQSKVTYAYMQGMHDGMTDAHNLYINTGVVDDPTKEIYQIAGMIEKIEDNVLTVKSNPVSNDPLMKRVTYRQVAISEVTELFFRKTASPSEIKETPSLERFMDEKIALEDLSVGMSVVINSEENIRYSDYIIADAIIVADQ